MAGEVNQIYYAFTPAGGIKVKEETVLRAQAAARVQEAKDQRQKIRSEEGALAMGIYTYSREILQEFLDLVGKPYEFVRKLFNLLL